MDGPALQPEGAGKDEIEGKPLGLEGVVRLQFQLNGVALGLEQGVLEIPCKPMLTALVGLAPVGERAAGQLARPREQDRCVAAPDRRICLPDHLLARCVFQADGLGTVGVYRQGQIVVLDRCLHRFALLFYKTLSVRFAARLPLHRGGCIPKGSRSGFSLFPVYSFAPEMQSLSAFNEVFSGQSGQFLTSCTNSVETYLTPGRQRCTLFSLFSQVSLSVSRAQSFEKKSFHPKNLLF